MDMIFLRFKAEFRFPGCPIPLSFFTIRFFCKVRVRVLFPILTMLRMFPYFLHYVSIHWLEVYHHPMRISLKNYV